MSAYPLHVFAFCLAGSRTLTLKMDKRGENEKERKVIFETGIDV
jgi:hypothetical protein